MPKTTKRGDAKKSELPSTLKKSDAKAQRTFAKAHDAAAEEYGEGERAHRVAYSALKHSYEKVGDHWEAKSSKGGPSDSRARSGGPNPKGKSAEGGVDANASKKHLLDVARRLDISGRSSMNKGELVEAIMKLIAARAAATVDQRSGRGLACADSESLKNSSRYRLSSIWPIVRLALRRVIRMPAIANAHTAYWTHQASRNDANE